MTGVAAIFWLSLLAILYAYIGYPVVLWLISRFVTTSKNASTEQNARLPSVTLIVSAFNEEKVIGAKIENALSLDYSRDLLEIVVVSDGSTDRTCEIVLRFADRGVVLRHYEGRIGKTACLNRAVPLAAGNIVVFSDANSSYENGALKALSRPFRDATVGFVTGWTKYGMDQDRFITEAAGIGLYSRLELITKELESRVGSCVGADGAVFAIRKELYSPLNAYDINDLVVPFTINLQGFRGVLQPGAVCFERDAGSSKGEFHRQVRIINRTIRAIVNYRRLLNPVRFGLLSFEIFSHKICKFLGPLFLVILFVSNLILAGEGAVYLATLLGQGVMYFGAGAAALFSENRILSRMAGTARTFVIVNVAIVMAWIKYFQGETFTTWSPTKR